eukprot:766976-Hanusia_phi.AAC.9
MEAMDDSAGGAGGWQGQTAHLELALEALERVVLELQAKLPEVSRRSLLERVQSLAVPLLLSRRCRSVKPLEAARRLVALCRVGDLAAKELCRWAEEALDPPTGGEAGGDGGGGAGGGQERCKEEGRLCTSVRGASVWLRLLSSLHADEVGRSCEEVTRVVKQLLERMSRLLVALPGLAGEEGKEVEDSLLYGIQTLFSLLCPMVESHKFLKDRYEVLPVLLQVPPLSYQSFNLLFLSFLLPSISSPFLPSSSPSVPPPLDSLSSFRPDSSSATSQWSQHRRPRGLGRQLASRDSASSCVLADVPVAFSLSSSLVCLLLSLPPPAPPRLSSDSLGQSVKKFLFLTSGCASFANRMTSQLGKELGTSIDRERIRFLLQQPTHPVAARVWAHINLCDGCSGEILAELEESWGREKSGDIAKKSRDLTVLGQLAVSERVVRAVWLRYMATDATCRELRATARMKLQGLRAKLEKRSYSLVERKEDEEDEEEEAVEERGKSRRMCCFLPLSGRRCRKLCKVITSLLEGSNTERTTGDGRINVRSSWLIGFLSAGGDKVQEAATESLLLREASVLLAQMLMRQRDISDKAQDQLLEVVDRIAAAEEEEAEEEEGEEGGRGETLQQILQLVGAASETLLNSEVAGGEDESLLCERDELVRVLVHDRLLQEGMARTLNLPLLAALLDRLLLLGLSKRMGRRRQKAAEVQQPMLDRLRATLLLVLELGAQSMAGGVREETRMKLMRFCQAEVLLLPSRCLPPASALAILQLTSTCEPEVASSLLCC